VPARSVTPVVTVAVNGLSLARLVLGVKTALRPETE